MDIKAFGMEDKIHDVMFSRKFSYGIWLLCLEFF